MCSTLSSGLAAGVRRRDAGVPGAGVTFTEKQIVTLGVYQQDAPVLVDFSVRGGFRYRTGEEVQSYLLSRARGYANHNLLHRLVGPVALPAGFDWASDWEEREDGNQPYRLVFADRHFLDDDRRCLSTAVVQFPDGTIGDDAIEVPSIALVWDKSDTGVKLGSDEARTMAAVLVAMADLLDEATR